MLEAKGDLGTPPLALMSYRHITCERIKYSSCETASNLKPIAFPQDTP